MIKTVLTVLFVLLAVEGLCELIHFIRRIIISPKKLKPPVLILGLYSGDAVANLKFAYEEKRWSGGRFASDIIAVDLGISDAEMAECRAIAGNHGIIICSTDMLGGIIKDSILKKTES